jgi:hypothetical protein
MKRRILSVALVVLLVVSSGFSPVGTALAAEQGDCSNLDDFVMFLTLGAVNAEDCSRQAYVEDAVQEMKESDANQTEVDIYSAASGVKSGQQSWNGPMDNYLQDTDSVAWMKAEKAVAEAYKNGSTKSEAKVAAKEAIAGYYATKQLNLIEQWNVSVSQTQTLREQAEMEDGISEFYVDVPNRTGTSSTTGETFIIGWNRTHSQTVSLVNGTTEDAAAVWVMSYNVDGDTWKHYQGDGSANATVNTGTTNDIVAPNTVDTIPTNITTLRVNPPNDNYDKQTVLNFTEFKNRWDRIDSQNSALQNEADNFVEATWTDFDDGSVNASDVVSSHTAMFEYGVRSGNESEGLWRSTAALSMMGYDSPDLNKSGTMTVEYNNTNYTGVVLADSAPGGTWDVGTSYDPSTFDSPVFMATTEGKKVDFNANFTVVGMTAKDGTQINSTQTTKYVYKTSNTSELLALQEDLTELRQEIEDRETDGGGSGGDSSLSSKEKTAGAIGLIALVLLIGGGKRRD